MRLNYAIKFVSDMDAAVAFYRDTLASPYSSSLRSGANSTLARPSSHFIRLPKTIMREASSLV